MLGQAPVTEEFHEMAQRFGKAMDDYHGKVLTFDGPSFPIEYIGSGELDVKKHSGEK